MTAASRAVSIGLSRTVVVADLAQAAAPYSLGTVTGSALETFHLIDSFDAAVEASAQALIQTRGTLELLRAEDATRRQAIDAPLRTTAELFDGPMKAGLKTISPLRRLMTLNERSAQMMSAMSSGQALMRLLTCDCGSS